MADIPSLIEKSSVLERSSAQISFHVKLVVCEAAQRLAPLAKEYSG
jgi:hypothetical protein